VGVNGECHFNKAGVGAKVAGVVNVTQVCRTHTAHFCITDQYGSTLSTVQ